MKKRMLLFLCLGLFSLTIVAQTTSINCETLNAVAATWKKSKFAELKGTLVGTNTAMKISRYKLKLPMAGALSSEVLIYPDAPDLNTVEIVLYQEATFSPTLSEKFAAIYKSLRVCVKDRQEDILSGTSTGLVDADGQMPELEFAKDGMPGITLVVEGPSITENIYKIVLKIEASEDDE